MRDIDHLVIAVIDLEAAADSFERAGYLVTPPADHPFGTTNRLVVFRAAYIELIAVSRPELLPGTGFAAAVARRLEEDRPGLTHIALRTSDPAGDAARHDAEVFEFSRPAPALDGSWRTASFTLVLPPPTDPMLFFCWHNEPGAVWHPAHLAHPNGAQELVGAETRQGFPEDTAIAAVDRMRFSSRRDVVSTDGTHESFHVAGIEISGSSNAS